jgi:hypothetical protein
MTLEGTRPRFGRIPAALEYAAVSKGRLYQWARLHPQLLKKNGRATLVDFDQLDAILDSLPTADLKSEDATNANAPAR